MGCRPAAVISRRGKSIITALGLSFDRGELANTGIGVAIGFLGIAAIFLVAYATRSIAVTGFGSGSALISDPVRVLVAPFLEELIFRGALLGGLLVLLPNRAWLAVVGSAAIFGALHLGNPNATLMSGIGSTLGGITYGIGFIATGALWLPYGLHFAWNYAQGPVFGFPLSGRSLGETLVQQENVGPDWFTGGAYGPEGGVVGFVGRVLVLVLLLAWIGYRRSDPYVGRGSAV